MVSPPPPRAERDWGEILLDLAAIALGSGVIWQTTQIRVTPAYAAVGPRVVPLLVGGGLVLIGLWLLAHAITGRSTVRGTESEDIDPTLPTDWRAVALLAVALLLYLGLMVPAGFVIATTVLFAGAAYAMGSRRLVRDVLLGLLLALALDLAFTAGLGLRLPAGPFAGFA